MGILRALWRWWTSDPTPGVHYSNGMAWVDEEEIARRMRLHYEKDKTLWDKWAKS